jgi:hypothetical protein
MRDSSVIVSHTLKGSIFTGSIPIVSKMFLCASLVVRDSFIIEFHALRVEFAC